MSHLTLYTHPRSRGHCARWMLEECGAQYKTVAIPFGAAMKKADYLAINPMGKVPALKENDTVITETAAIITHLAGRYPDKALIPTAGSSARGEYYRWLCFALHLEYAAVDKWRGITNNDEQRRAIGYGEYETAIQTLKTRLTNRENLIGGQFGAIDLYYSSLLAWLIHSAQVLPAETTCTDYIQRHFSRPAHIRAQQQDEALHAEMEAAGNT